MSDLPFNGFLDYLGTQGFAIGVDHHLRLWRVLSEMGEAPSPGELQSVLCPLFATNGREQAQFKAAFLSYFAAFIEAANGTTSLAERVAPGNEFPIQRFTRPRRLITAYTMAATLILFAAALTWFLWTSRGKTTDVPDTTFRMPTEFEDATLGASPQESTKRARKRGPNNKAVRWLILIVPLMLWSAVEWNIFRRRQLVIERRRGRKPPFDYKLALYPPELFELRSQAFYTAALKLRRRQAAEFQRLDIPRTIDATVRAHRFPVLQFRSASQYPEYLILIERASFRDHQAEWFDAIAAALEDEGILLERYFFDSDPRICRRDGASIRLSELHSRFPLHRLIIFGDGARLLEAVSGKPAPWTAMLSDWAERAILTPVPESSWSSRERTLGAVCLVLPASIEGLDALGDHFNGVSSNNFSLSFNGSEVAVTGERVPRVPELREWLGEPIFQWLCGCAAYPELHWRLTVMLGLLPCMPPDLTAEENLLKLSRLQWFRDGSIPNEARLELIAALAPENSVAVRTALVELLEATPVQIGSIAADHLLIDLAAQRGPLNRNEPSALRQALKSIESLPPEDLDRDYALVCFQESASIPI